MKANDNHMHRQFYTTDAHWIYELLAAMANGNAASLPAREEKSSHSEMTMCFIWNGPHHQHVCDQCMAVVAS